MRAMKDSGVEWIGEIPQEWGTIKFKYLHAGMNTGEGIDKEFWSTNETDKIFYTAGLVPIHTTYLDFPEWKFTEENDLLLARNGTPYVYYPEKGACYTDHIIRAKLNKDVNKRFVQYCLQQSISSIVVESVSIATWSASLWNEQLIPYPSLGKQRHIVEYLDSKCSKIDTIIEKQQAVIEKLKEYKLSMITEAVTKGLNLDVEMKDSGVEWIGEVPKTTTVTRAGHVFDIILGKMLANIPSSETDTMEKYFCAANVHFTGIDYENLKVMWFSEKEKQIYKVNIGDLLVVEGGAGAGGAFVVDRDTEDIYVQNSIFIVRSTGNVSAKWLQYSLFALVNRGYIDFVCNKATIPHFTKEKLSDVPVVIFSSVDEKFILNFLDDKCEQINNSIANREQLIDKLREYKKSLIYEVVTGKKEV